MELVLPTFSDCLASGLSDRTERRRIPSSRMLLAALRSRSCIMPHAHVQTRSPRPSAVFITPQAGQVLELGNQRSIFCTVLPRHWALYSTCLTNSDSAASPSDLPRFPRAMPLTFKSSSITASYSFTTRLESWCSQLARRLAIRLWIRDTASLAFALRFDPFSQRLSFFCALASLVSSERKNFGGATSW